MSSSDRATRAAAAAAMPAGNSSQSIPSTSGISVNFEKLTGVSNYSNWKFLMQMYLIHEDLWDCIEESASTAGTPKNVDARKQQKALAKICLMVQPSSFSHVRNASTGYQAWSNLKKAYEDRGLCRRLGLLRMLFGLKLEQFGDMEAYLLKICDLDQQLRDINAPLEDDFLGVLMLSGLSSDYDPLIMALENSNFKLNSDTVKCKLLQENIRRDFVNDTCQENSLYTINRSSKGDNKKQSIATIKCFACKKLGHFARNCPSKSNVSETSEKAWNGTLLTALAVNIKSNAWYVDSGATCHMTNNKGLLVNYIVDSPRLVTVANNQKMYSEGHGEVKLLLKGHKQTTTLTEVIFVPDLSTNLLSVNKITDKGLEVVFNIQKCNIYCGELAVASATKVNGVYELDIATDVCELTAVCQSTDESQPLSGAESAAEATEAANFCEEKSTQELWHRRLGHLNRRSMDLLKRGMASGIDYTDSDFTPCVACIEGKHFRLPFPKRSYTRATEKLGLIHSDLCGPMSVPSFSGAKYLLTFIDDFTRKTFVYFVKSKDEVLENFKLFKTYAENQTGLTIKMLRTDNGGEYVNNLFQAFLKDHGIEHQTTVPYSPQQNGVAERANRTIVEATRCMLQDAGMEKQYWAEAANTAVFIKNRSPTKAVMGITPEAKWTGKKIDLTNMRVFGCVAYALVPYEKRKKLDAKSQRLVFVGYCTDSKGYRLVDPSVPSKCIKSRDVQFLEGKMYKDFHNDCKIKDDQMDKTIQNLECGDVTVQSVPEIEDSPRSVEVVSDSDSENDENPSDVTWNPNMTSDMSSSDGEYHESVAVATAAATSYSDEPLTVQEALSGPECEYWRAAITDEYQSFEDNKAWTLMPLPAGKKAVKCKWVFKKKYGADGELLRYKARLVAKGFTQKYGIDYRETYSPVVRYSTIRTLLALAVNLDMQVDHMDVKTAFLNGDLTETVFMEQPEGYIAEGKGNYVFKLNKAIYGLKQASRAWYEKIDKALVDLQFRKSLNEPCVYIKQDNTGELIILALYVDDILLISKNTPEKKELKEELMRIFEMKDLGKASHILGMRLRQEQGKISIDQKNYIQKVLEKFNMADCKPACTPLENGLKLEKGSQNDLHSQYRSLIGCIMYVAVCTRPDIAHAASILSQFNDCHSDSHWKAAKRVLRYLKGTMDYNLVYMKSELTVRGFVDADWASTNIDRRSYTGYIFEIGGSAVSWESRKQRTVALSSTEAEYMAIGDGTKEAIFIRSFLNECIGKLLHVTLYNDSQSAQKLCNSQIHHSRSKHIDVRHHFVRQVVKDKIVNLEYMCTEQMPADVLTKPLCKDKHYNCIKNIGLKIIA